MRFNDNRLFTKLARLGNTVPTGFRIIRYVDPIDFLSGKYTPSCPNALLVTGEGAGPPSISSQSRPLSRNCGSPNAAHHSQRHPALIIWLLLRQSTVTQCQDGGYAVWNGEQRYN